MRQQVLFNKTFQQMSNLKHMSNSKVKAPPCMHKDTFGAENEVKGAIATVTQLFLRKGEFTALFHV